MCSEEMYVSWIKFEYRFLSSPLPCSFCVILVRKQQCPVGSLQALCALPAVGNRNWGYLPLYELSNSGIFGPLRRRQASRSRGWRVISPQPLVYQCKYWLTFPLAELMSLNRSEEPLNTRQRQQRRAREASRQLNENGDESPSRRRTPAPRPETPTPRSVAVERTRAASRRSRRESQENELQHSPRRRRTFTTQDENFPNISGDTGSQECVIHVNRVRNFNSFRLQVEPHRPPLASPRSYSELFTTNPSFDANGP